MLLVSLMPVQFKVSFEETNSFRPNFHLSLIIRWRAKEIKSRGRTVVSPVAISPSPCLPPEELTGGLHSLSAPLYLQSHIAFSPLALCTSAVPYPNFGSSRFALCKVPATHPTSLSAVQSCRAHWCLKHTNDLAG